MSHSHDLEKFQAFVRPLIGLPVSLIWKGYGSAIFLEIGELSTRTYPNGRTARTQQGLWTIAIQWSWRLEGKKRIWCGSWSDQERWLPLLNRLVGCSITGIELFGRLPEIDVCFSNGLHLLLLMTADGDPEWGISQRNIQPAVSVGVRAGQLLFV